SGGLTVQPGATLGGNITAGGTTAIQAGGTLAVGNSPGTGSFSTLTLAGTTVMDIASRGSAGIAFDTIAVSSSLIYGGELKLTFSGSVSSDALTPFTLFTGTAGGGLLGSVTIYGSGGYVTTLSNSSGTTWSGLANLGYGSGTQSFTFTQSDGNLIVAVPEPTTWALLAFSLTTVMVLRRRRNS
ncbi:MAG: PEP-CTERM sorting domain-containing protein, partial [Terrimicrobiaceae bacterium]